MTRLLPIWSAVARQDAEFNRRYERIMHRKPARLKPPAVTVWLLPSPFPRQIPAGSFWRADTHYLGTNERHLAGRIDRVLM